MIRRKISRALTRWLIAVLVFAQGALAVNACLAATSARVDAVAAAAHEGCDMQQSNRNLCVYHCADQYNSGGSGQLSVLAPAPSMPAAPAWNEAAPSTEARTIASRATGPPIPIRHCRLHI